ncbi:MAG: M20 family peptidase [Rubrivivax sp.]|nr:M20 family peptidase [Rubrivivax sp.]
MSRRFARIRGSGGARMLKRALITLGALTALLLLLAAALVVNTLRQGSRQVVVPALAPMAVDKAAVADSLAIALRAKTVSGLADPTGVAAEFEALHAHLKARYPLVHAALEREGVGAHSLLYTWRGSDAKALPMALLAHQDVVPIAPGTEALWKQPPFSGLVADGFVWGRGALDNKSNLVAQFEAVEALLKAGFKPHRTVFFFFGHDEEVGGQRGAVEVVKLFNQRGVKLAFVLDEGMAVTEGILPGVAQPIALIGLGEKGAITLKLTAQASPGHSSMPPAPGESAIGRLSAALARIDGNPLPGGIQGAAAEMFAVVGPELPFGQRLAMSNLWLLRPVVEGMLAKGAATNALMRTTTALTIVNAGNKENVLPGQAEAVVNFRILPGDTSQSVVAHVKRVMADERIALAPCCSAVSEPSRISSAQAEPYRQLERTIREVFPDSMVAPSLTLQGTDSRHFDAVAEQVYRFMPIRFKPEDLRRLHGTDERIAVDQLADMVRFYHRLLQTTAAAAP